MTDEELTRVFYAQLGAELIKADAWKNEQRPLLAHYSSIHSLERIINTEEIWLSNPLFMNDTEEIRFGFNAAREEFLVSDVVRKACGSEERADKAIELYLHYFRQFEDNHALDVYVFCLSEHAQNDNDGRLSMWRAYARNGNGAAIVFDTKSLEYMEGSPLAIAKVDYKSPEERRAWITRTIEQWADLLVSAKVETERLYLPVFYLFQVFAIYALTTKHHGFAEEQEWRVIYTPERDEDGLLKQRFSYVVTERGIEPKLKLPLIPMQGVTGDALSLKAITDRVILGPSIASPLARNSFIQMLQRQGKSWLADKVHSSTIPFRPT